MDDENLDLEDLAALLDEDDDELFAMVDGDSGDKDPPKGDKCPNDAKHDKDMSHRQGSPVPSSSSQNTSGAPKPKNTTTLPQRTFSEAITAGVPSRELRTVASDLALSDEETQHRPAPDATNEPDPDDPTDSEILALEAKLAKLKQKKQSKTSPKSLRDVVGKIKKPASPNKSRFIDTTGIVPSTVKPADLPPSQRSSLEERVRAMLRKPESAVHGGDTDSSEDEDNRTPFQERYNEFGRDVKRLAHGAASGSGRDQLQERAEHVNRAAQRALKPKTAARKADGGRPAVPEQPHEEIMIDSYAKISVTNPRLTSAELRDCLQGKRLIRVSQLESNVRGDGIAGDWVTIGVIARKSDSRTSQKGSTYSSWTLTDLLDCQKPAKVMLFGEAHSALWKTTVGTVVALANSKIMKDKEMSGSSGTTLSIISGKHCIMLGSSPDLDFCKAKCKNGRICLSFLNKRHCPVCVFHMTAEYKKTSSKRGELQSMTSVAPRKPLGGAGGGGGGGGGQLLHEGSLSSGPAARRDSDTAALRLRDRERLSSLKLQKQCQETLNAKKKQLSTLGLKHITQVEAKAIATVAEDSVEMGELLLKPCAGARNLLRHLTDSADAASTDLADSRTAEKRRVADPAAMLKEEAQRRRLPAPRLARNVAIGQTVDLDGSPRQTSGVGVVNKGQARALALLRKSGPLKKTNPNAVRARPSDQKKQNVMKRVARKPDENSHSVPTPDGSAAAADSGPAAKRSRLADDPKFRAVLEARSSHASALEAELTEGQEYYFQALEKKELIENKMLTTFEVKTKAVYCRKCKYRALSASDLCKSEGHTTVLLDAVKRFFSCNGCKSRTISLDKLPRLPCQNCGGDSWKKAAMGKERAGPKLDSEILSIRGNEAFSVSTHVKDHNINLEF